MLGRLGLLVLGLWLGASQVQAQGLILGEPAYGGTGCPAGTASVNVSPDGQALSVLFDNYISQAGRSTGSRIARSSCSLSIPVYVPSGYSVAVFAVDYRGFNSIPMGGQSRFDAEYFWAGSRGPRTTRTFVGPMNDNFTVTDNLLAQTLVWAPCGASVNLRMNTSMLVQSNSRMDEIMASVDSADISSAVVYHLQWRKCF